MISLKHGLLSPAIGACLLVLTVLPASAADPIPVQARPLAALAIYPKHRAPASVVSENDSRISAEVGAPIVEIPVRVGEVVKKDAVLARLEPTDLALALAREQAAARGLQARIELARYQLTRARSLAKKKAVSEELLRQREAELRSLLAELEGQEVAVSMANRRLDKTTVRAPFKAIVMARLGQAGELASPGTPLVRIVDADRLEVSAALQADLAAALPKAKHPELVSAGQRYALSLRTITPAFDPRARTREARLTFAGAAAMPGRAGELVWRSNRPSVPAELLVRREGKLGIFVLQADRAHFVALPGAEEGRPAPVSLPTETRLITEGRFRLNDGDPVSVQP